jgi:hypothetical protein
VSIHEYASFGKADCIMKSCLRDQVSHRVDLHTGTFLMHFTWIPGGIDSLGCVCLVMFSLLTHEIS